MPSSQLPETLARPFEQVNRRELAVIGGGIIGLSAAYAAAIRGKNKVKVNLFESSDVGHPEAASSDLNRIFRYLHGPDPSVLAWAKEAYKAWDFFSEQADVPILHHSGVLFLVHQQRDSDEPGHHVRPYQNVGSWVDDSLQIMDAERLPYTRLTYAEIERRYPQINDPSIREAVFDHNAGFLEAQSAVSTLADMCREAGVEFHPGLPVRKITPDGGGCLIQLSNGGQARADTAVVAINGWTSDLIDLPYGTLTLTEQPVIYLTPPTQDMGDLPIFISLNTDCYGFPKQNDLIKIGNDKPYRTILHPNERLAPQADYVNSVIETISNFVPNLKGAKVDTVKVCFYDRSKDGRFILDAWDADARIIFGCGMSGRAFKFAPVIGERLARFAISGQRPDDISGFSIR